MLWNIEIRTTIRLDELLMKRAKREALRRGETFTALVDEGIRLALAKAKKEASRRKVSLPENGTWYRFRLSRFAYVRMLERLDL